MYCCYQGKGSGKGAGKGGDSTPDFQWSASDEPHATRRMKILAKYPEIKKLYGHCPKTKYKCAAVVLFQTAMAYMMRDVSWGKLVFFAYFVGGTLNHMMELGVHELSHSLGFPVKQMKWNKIFGIIANLPMGIPVSVTFKRYHMEHHRYQGEHIIDADIPSQWELDNIKGPFAKALAVFFQAAFYGLRPSIVNPKAPILWEGINWAAQVSYDALIAYFFGWKGLAYLLLGTFLGMGLHPVAGHFIAEHYTFIQVG
jgi:sphingolipid delta-4 desaturase